MNREEFEKLRQQYQTQMMQLYPKNPPPPPRRPMPSPPPDPPRRPMPAPPPEPPYRPMPAPPPEPPRRPMPAPPPEPPRRPMPAPPPEPMPDPMPPMADVPSDLPIFAPPESALPPRGWNGNSLPTGAMLGMETPLPMDLPPQTPPPNGDYTETGTLRVNVRTAEGAVPVADATVTVTEDRGGDRALIALRRTDDSGAVTLTLPAPATAPDTRNVKSAKYIVEVFAPGYLREASVDLPVFAGITSVQTFTLVPLPLTASDTQEQVYYNTEPNF